MSQAGASSQLIPFNSSSGPLSVFNLGQLAKATPATKDASAAFVVRMIEAGYLEEVEEVEDTVSTVVSAK